MQSGTLIRTNYARPGALTCLDRYLRATEVGRPPSSVKYELAIKFGTVKNGPVVRNRIRLPYPVLSSVRIGVICKEGSKLAEEARQAGAVDVGEESLYEAIRTGNTTFNRLLCHGDCQDSLMKANLGRILGPKGLMPNPKQRTVTHDVVGMMREMLGAGDYREKMGVVRVPIGMLGFTPQMLAENVTAFMKAIKKELAKMEDMVAKDVQEVVLSSTNGPGLSLSGAFNPSDESIAPEHLATAV